MLKEILKKLPTKLIITLVVLAFIYLAVVVTYALSKGADVSIVGIKLSWQSKTESLSSELESLISKNKESEIRINNLKNQVENEKQLLIKYKQNIALAKQKTAEIESQYSSLMKVVEKKDKKITELKANNIIFEKLLSIKNQIVLNEELLKEKHNEYNQKFSKYSKINELCKKGESFYNQSCAEKGELYGAVTALTLEIDTINKQLDGDRKVFQQLLGKSM